MQFLLSFAPEVFKSVPKFKWDSVGDAETLLSYHVVNVPALRSVRTLPLSLHRQTPTYIVAPVVKWSQEDGSKPQDPWSKTYVTRDKSPSKISTIQRTFTGQGSIPNQPSSSVPGSPTKRFPRPTNQKPLAVSLDRRVSDHIASSTSHYRPPSPLKHSTTLPHDNDVSDANPEEGILPNLSNGSRLAKVYGSVLQPEETLSTFICAICSAPFPPDATIYPDPTSIRPGFPIEDVGSGSRFLCRPCFTANGGSKGDCPACGKPVLILKSDGGFVETNGKVWHKRCFCCEGCFKNIGDRPMVDLLGRPSCADCFESCLKRPSGNTPRKPKDQESLDERSNLGGTRRSNKSREGSPALEELEMRLGIKSRDNTPVKDTRSARFLSHGSSPAMQSPSSPPSTQSPLSNRYSATQSSPAPDRLSLRTRAYSNASAGSSAARDVLSRHQTPDTHSGDGSPVPRRSYNRLMSPDLDSNDGSPISSRLTGSGSPRYGSPVSRQPTADAIEEMKQRFLKQASPGPPSTPGRSSIPSQPTTPTHRERRSRSRPRSSGAMSPATYNDMSSLNNPSYSAGHTQPLRTIRRENTGGTEFTSRSAGTEDKYGHRESELHTDYASGNQVYTRRDENERARVRSDITGGTDYTLRRDRTGDAEVESLLGSFPSVPTGDLIDLSSDTSMTSIGSQSTGSGMMSRIPRPTRGLTSPDSGRIGLGISMGSRQSPSNSSVTTDFYSLPPTPDLGSDFSDAATHSSGPSTPPSLSPPSRRTRPEGNKAGSTAKSEATTPTPKSRTLPADVDISIPSPLPPDSRCSKCNLPLFSRKDGGKFVTVPEMPSSSGAPPKTYHTSCFRCTVCNGLFEDKEGGRAVFVRGPSGVCHVEVRTPYSCSWHPC